MTETDDKEFIAARNELAKKLGCSRAHAASLVRAAAAKPPAEPTPATDAKSNESPEA